MSLIPVGISFTLIYSDLNIKAGERVASAHYKHVHMNRNSTISHTLSLPAAFDSNKQKTWE